jgi:hypothetical protein
MSFFVSYPNLFSSFSSISMHRASLSTVLFSGQASSTSSTAFHFSTRCVENPLKKREEEKIDELNTVQRQRVVNICAEVAIYINEFENKIPLTEVKSGYFFSQLVQKAF